MIFVEDGNVKVGGIMLPGIFKQIEISGEAIVDEIEVEGSGKKPKQATGYEEAVIKIEISLDNTETQTVEEKVKIINDIFKPSGVTVPPVYKIINSQTAARGISDVIFKSFATKSTNKNNTVSATLEFCEYTKVSVVTKKKNSNTKTAKSSSKSNSSAKSSEFSDYLLNSRGKAPSINKNVGIIPGFDTLTDRIYNGGK